MGDTSSVSDLGLTAVHVPENAMIDIVFVHGLQGHPRRTWTCETAVGPEDLTLAAQESRPRQGFKRLFPAKRKPDPKLNIKRKEVFWPAHLLPVDCPSARLLTWGYASNTSNFFGGPANKNSVFAHAKDLLYELDGDRTDFQKRPLIFVAHSLGGIIVKDVLRRANAEETAKSSGLYNIYTSTRAVFFLGTPHRGSSSAEIGDIVRRIVGLAGFDTNDKNIRALQIDSAELEFCQEEFIRLYNQGHFGVRTFQEAKGLTGMSFSGMNEKVVKDISSTLTGSSAERTQTINANHVSMCRFTGREDNGYKKVSRELKAFVSTEMKKLQEDKTPNEELNADHLGAGEQACLRTLSYPEMESRLLDIPAPFSNTCSWLLDHPNYVEWLREGGLLWIKGNPGAGKTTLTRVALQKAKERKKSEGSIILAFFFHGRGTTLQRTPLGLFRALLHQLLIQHRLLRREFRSLFELKEKTQENWSWHATELRDFFSSAVTRTAKITPIKIFVDALDECGDQAAKQLVTFFCSLTAQLPEAGSALSICFSCRHFPIIALEDGLDICVENNNRSDIQCYVQAELQPCAGMREILQKDILDRASGIFQWVVLVVSLAVERYRDGRSLPFIREKLQKVPKDLHSLYKHMLSSVDDEDRPQTLRLMQWVCFAQRPLSVTELRFAMALYDGSPYSSLQSWQASNEYVEDDTQMAKLVKRLSHGLAEVKDREDQLIVQFIHQSVNDFLLDKGIEELDRSFTGSVVGRGHHELSRSCINYVTMEELHDIRAMDLYELDRRFPFLVYAASFAFTHAQVAESEDCSQKDLVTRFQWPDQHVFQVWVRAWLQFSPLVASSSTDPKTLLHVTSLYNLSSAVRVLLEKGADIQAANGYGATALHLAAQFGNELVVRLLVEKGADIQAADGHGVTALHLAARAGHELVVRLLVEKGADIQAADGYGATALHHAARNGHEAVVRLLVEKGADIQAANGYGATALHLAALCGDETVVRLLVEKGADIKVVNSDGETALRLATKRGHKAVIRLLEALIISEEF